MAYSCNAFKKNSDAKPICVILGPNWAQNFVKTITRRAIVSPNDGQKVKLLKSIFSSLLLAAQFDPIENES